MPEVENVGVASIIFLGTEIGRGHPMYLDGIIDRMRIAYPDIPFFATDVFAASSGVAAASWRLIRRLYYAGGKGGLITAAYDMLRKSRQGRAPLAAGKVLGRDIRRLIRGIPALVVVSHPLTASLLAPYGRIIYQHGELAAPAEAIVTGCTRILVPLPETAELFISGGLPRENVTVTGQCIELELLNKAESAFRKRLARLREKRPLTAAFFSSGAYPSIHLRRLRAAAVSFCRAGHSAIIFSGLSAKVNRELTAELSAQLPDSHDALGKSGRWQIITSRNRAEENRMAANLMEEIDLLVAPAHERTNWAVGLGLPHGILCPHIGSYAPHNAAMALARNVAVEITDDHVAASWGEIASGLRDTGRLVTMATSGYGCTAIDGFSQAADIVAALARVNPDRGNSPVDD